MDEFEQQHFGVDADVNFHELEDAEFESCSFSGLDFSNISFRSWCFFECRFEKCSFSEVDLVNAVFRDMDFVDCRMMGLNWADCKTLLRPKFVNCKLDYSVFQGIDLKKTSFLDCAAKDTDFANANLSEAIFTGTFLRNASFTQADLRKADLRGALEYFIDPKFTRLQGAKVSFPEAGAFLTALGLEVID